MIEVKGKYNSAKIFTDVVDESSTSQVIELCNQDFTAVSKIRLMPDIHAGAGCTIGMILRKGAVSAKTGEQVLIPINMRDGSLLCVGKGNEDWNFSAPHGAGRLMSRVQAKQSFKCPSSKSKCQRFTPPQ